MLNFVYRVSDGKFLFGGPYDVVAPKLANGQPDPAYGVVALPDDQSPDPITERVDLAAASKRRPATAQEQTAALDDAIADTATGQSRRADVLTMLAWTVRRQNVPAWNAMTNQQKKAAVLAEADNWRDLRVFIHNALS